MVGLQFNKIIMGNIIDTIFSKERIASQEIFLYYPDTNYSLSYKDLYEQSLNMACGLREYGIKSGDKVLVFFDNTPQSVILAFSLIIAGAVLVPVEPGITNESLQYIIKNSDCRFSIYFAKMENVNIGHTIAIDYEKLKCFHKKEEAISSFYLSPDDGIVILYTSGSTGNPKGIVFTYESVIRNFTEYGRIMKFSDKTRFLQVMPMYHADGWNFTLLIPYLFNCSVVLTPKFNLNVCKDIYNVIKEYKCNVLVAIPSILDSIILFSQRYDKKELPCLDYVITSSEKLCKTTKIPFEELFNCRIYDLYGLTETQIVSYYNKDIDWIEGSVGKLQKGVQAKFEKDGELLVKSPYLFKEYCNNKALTDIVKKDGWFSTGDLGRMSEDGYLFLVGRKNDIINKGGEKVSPNEIDTIIKELDFVKDCYTLGVDDDVYGQEIFTLVILLDGINDDQDTVNNIKKYCSQKIKKNLVPKYIVFVDSFPMNRSGKKDKMKIREMVKDKYNI